MTTPITALLFDKDGTLFHFGETWNLWALAMIDRFSAGQPDRRAAIAASAGFDLTTNSFHPKSPVIAGTSRDAALAFAPALPEYDLPTIESILSEGAANAPLAPTVPLAPFLGDLRARGYGLGVMTNDTEFAARSHLTSAGVLDSFDFIAGFDSGFGAKPDPRPLLAFADAIGQAPASIAMIGDSTHDLSAGRAAGMRCVGVLTGPALRADLAPFADVVLPDIGHLPGWLASLSPEND
ncbi:HAD family hydrolase [Tropicibacter oceani]|uniref:phosphoglycolate phosphatase n=1 Tax=Tropicibacter oceani TaxID=3058420 RepID=A0ABY8QLS4_9RHOB|nr:HAD family hydrolase [Tropicibacter oceani]WGW05594.1 HAD family hydrolase [Tropicibacter oceani]